MKQVLFLSISSISGALDRDEVTEADMETALIHANHAREQFDAQDVDYTVALELSGAKRPKIHSFVERANREKRVSWARMAGSRRMPSTWSRLNVFLLKHGLNQVPKDDQYTTSEACRRVLAANPGWTVYP